MDSAKKLIEKYYSWLQDKTFLKDFGEWTEITTPFLDRHNDYIQIYLKKEGDEYILSDDGYTINDLISSGCVLDSPKRRKLIDLTLNGFAIKKDDKNCLFVRSNFDTLHIKKHCLIQSILAINDLFYLAKAHVSSLFFEDVKNWLDMSDIRSTENVIFKGKSGFDRKFDFVIPKSKNANERILKVVNNFNKNSADLFIVEWLDTKDIRPNKANAYILANDNEEELSPQVIDALRNYEINTIPWSKRDSHVEMLRV
ncbi:DUF1829 domain-containing protein [Candidatus Avelusimicrobium alvi]|uniref:DUF1829 domain-containing protein n=1 Tax=Candidatus Avelusimicrobium alvi TaxID=3416221 RepID=UPI003D140FF1